MSKQHVFAAFGNRNLSVHSYWQVESEKRCGLGGFAVNKTGTCNEHATIKENANG